METRFVIARSSAARDDEAIQLDRDDCLCVGGHGALCAPRDDNSNGNPTSNARSLDRMKRLFDFSLSAVALVLLSPLLLAIAVMVRCCLGSPVLFSQRRPGRHGHVFILQKFRTMSDAVAADGRPLSDAERLGRFGLWLRATSLDELPELWNILRGDMSFVGPRPLLVEYLACYSAEEARRHEVRPGLTGWAQINGRNALTWQEKFRMDVWYVDHRTFWLDLRIIVVTAARVFRREGISAAGEVTMPRFTGTPKPPQPA